MNFNRDVSPEELNERTETIEAFIKWVETAPRKDLEDEMKRCYLSSVSRHFDRVDALAVLDKLKVLLD